MPRLFVNGLTIDVFTPRAPVGRAALFCNGFPGSIGPLPPVVFALLRGWHVVFAQYPGTYESEGTFSPYRASEALADLLQDNEWSKDAPGLPSVTLGLGHSFGGNILFELLTRHPDATELTDLLLLAPIVACINEPDIGVRENLSDQFAYVAAKYPHTYRLSPREEWEPVISGVTSARQSNWGGRIHMLIGEIDGTFEVPLAVDALPQFLAAQLKTDLQNVTAEVVAGAGHAMHELLANGVGAESFLRRAM